MAGGGRKGENESPGRRWPGASLVGLLARRFLFSPKSHSVINLISRVSMVAVGIPVAAMVILMSVFSGFDELIRRMYRDFDPDVVVVPSEGKVFDPERLDIPSIAALDGVAAVGRVLEESALVEYRGSRTTVRVRGVDSLFKRIVPIGKMLTQGSVGDGGAILGQGVAYKLGGVLTGADDRLSFYALRRETYSALLPQAGFSEGELRVDGIFALDADTDSEFVVTPITFAQELFDYSGMASSLAVRLTPEASLAKVKKRVAAIAGEDFLTLDRYEQKASMYRIMRLEKWGIFFIGVLVLVIASFSIVGSLVMLVIDKGGGIRTLRALGADTRLIRRVFVRQGVIIGAIGAAAGLVLGVAVCAVQQIFGVIPMPGATFLVSSYPVRMRALDIAAICVAFLTVIRFIAIFTVRITIKNEKSNK